MKNMTVMIAEDEALVALDLMDSLRDEGLDVVGPCMSLADCLDFLDGPERIDAAVLDVDLHGQDVFPAAAMLQARGIPFVFHTGHATIESLPGEFAGVELCRKPTEAGRIAGALRRLVH